MQPTQVKHLSGSTVYGSLLALPTTNTQDWKGLPVANTSAYYKKFVTYCCKMFYNIDPWVRIHNTLISS
jgi:hypothetical protein